MNDPQKIPPKRPFLFKVLVLSLLIISLAGWMRLAQSIYQWQILVAFNIFPGPVYTAVSGALVGITAGMSALILWLRLPRAKLIVQLSLVMLFSGWWLDYLIFTRSNLAFANLPFRLVATAGYLIFAFLYLHYAPAIQRIRKNK